MTKLEDLIQRVPDPDLRDRLLRQAEREGVTKPPPLPPISLRVGITLSDITAAVLSIPGVESAEVVPGEERHSLRVTADVAWGVSKTEVAQEIARTLYRYVPVDVRTLGAMTMAVGDHGAVVNFTLRDV